MTCSSLGPLIRRIPTPAHAEMSTSSARISIHGLEYSLMLSLGLVGGCRAAFNGLAGNQIDYVLIRALADGRFCSIQIIVISAARRPANCRPATLRSAGLIVCGHRVESIWLNWRGRWSATWPPRPTGRCRCAGWRCFWTPVRPGGIYRAQGATRVWVWRGARGHGTPGARAGWRQAPAPPRHPVPSVPGRRRLR